MQRFVPIAVTKAEVLSALDDIRRGVETGDTLEGSIQFLIPYPPDGDPEEADFMMQASYRIGNLAGQGGMRTIGRWAEPSGPQEVE